MRSELQRRVSDAVLAGSTLDVIERTIINRAVIDEEQRAALWLYANALREQPSRCAGAEIREPTLTSS